MMRLSKSIRLLLVAAAIIGGLLSCANPLIDRPDTEQEGAGLDLTLVIPDYDHDMDRTAAPQVIAPQTEWIRIVLDDQVFMEIDVVGDSQLESTETGQTPPTFSAEIWGIPARYYREVRFELLDGAGDVLTSGSAFDVQFEENILITLNIACFIAGGAYESLSVYPDPSLLTAEDPPNPDPRVGFAAAGTMSYYKFFTTAGETYTVTLTPDATASGTPDLYLFTPLGTLSIDDSGTPEDETDDVVHKALWNVENAVTTGPLEITFAAAHSGRHAIGVYGWGAVDANYGIQVTSVGTYADPAQADVDSAFVLLHQQDWSGASSAFQTAVAKNASNPKAALGYAALSIVNLLVHPDVVDVATNGLGLADYPSDLNVLLSSDWLEQMVWEEYDDWSGETYEEIYFVPRITGQEDFDGVFGGDTDDGIIDDMERLMAFLRFVWAGYTDPVSGESLGGFDGLDPIIDIISTTIADQLGSAVAALDATDDGMRMSLTWDMVFDTQGEARNSGWPFMGGYPLEVTIGKAELYAMASYLSVVQGMGYLSGAYTYSLFYSEGVPMLEKYWNEYFNPFSGSFHENQIYPDKTPFDDPAFLALADDAGFMMSQARDAMIRSFEYVKDGLASISSRPYDAGFTFPDMLVQEEDEFGEYDAALSAQTWIDYRDVIVPFGTKVADEMLGSLIDPTQNAIIPMPTDPPYMEPQLNELADFEYYVLNDYANWPTAIAEGSAVGVNPGLFFSEPLTLRAIAELKGSGEPVWYRLDTTDPAAAEFVPLTPSEQIGLNQTNNGTYYARILDATLGGLIPEASLEYMRDDASNLFQVYVQWDDYTTGDPLLDGNGLWDPAETLYGVDVNSAIGGAFNLADFETYVAGDMSTAPYDPFDYYAVGNYLSRDNLLSWAEATNVDSDPYYTAGHDALLRYCAEADLAAFQTAIAEYDPVEDGYSVPVWFDSPVAGTPIPYIDGTSLYVPVPEDWVWHSVTPVGEGALDEGGNWIRSTGSVWYPYVQYQW